MEKHTLKVWLFSSQTSVPIRLPLTGPQTQFHQTEGETTKINPRQVQFYFPKAWQSQQMSRDHKEPAGEMKQ